jgi:tetratricopeptide (TPR) repeat protein
VWLEAFFDSREERGRAWLFEGAALEKAALSIAELGKPEAARASLRQALSRLEGRSPPISLLPVCRALAVLGDRQAAIDGLHNLVSTIRDQSSGPEGREFSQAIALPFAVEVFLCLGDRGSAVEVLRGLATIEEEHSSDNQILALDCLLYLGEEELVRDLLCSIEWRGSQGGWATDVALDRADIARMLDRLGYRASAIEVLCGVAGCLSDRYPLDQPLRISMDSLISDPSAAPIQWPSRDACFEWFMSSPEVGAARLLALFDSNMARTVLAKCSSQGNELSARVSAAEALGDLGDIDAMAAALDDAVPEYVSANTKWQWRLDSRIVETVGALARWGRQRDAKRMLQALLFSTQVSMSVRLKAGKELGRLGSRNDVIRLLHELSATHMEAIPEIAGAMIELGEHAQAVGLLGDLSTAPNAKCVQRLQAVKGLAELGVRSDTSVVLNVDHNRHCAAGHIDAGTVLISMGDQEGAITIMRASAFNRRLDPNARLDVLLELLRIDLDPRNIALLRALAEDSRLDGSKRVQASEELWSLGEHETAISVLLSVGLSPTHPKASRSVPREDHVDARIQAGDQLVLLGETSRARQIFNDLSQYLESRDVDSRRAAYKATTRLGLLRA